MKRTWTFGTAAAVAALALTAAGCGGSGDNGTTSTSAASASQAWANSVCSALVSWQRSVQQTADDLRSGGVSKAAVQDAAGQVQDATASLTDALKGLDTPDLPSGQEAKTTVDTLATQLQTGVDTIDKAVKDVSGVSGALNAVSVVSGTLATMGTQLTSAFDTLKGLDPSGELHDAFAQSQACQDLSSSTSTTTTTG